MAIDIYPIVSYYYQSNSTLTKEPREGMTMLFGFGKKPSPVPDEQGPNSIHPRSKKPTINEGGAAGTTKPPQPPKPQPKPVLSPTEMEQLRQAKFKALKIPFEHVKQAEKALAEIRPNFTKFNPDDLEKDWHDVSKRLVAFGLKLEISALELFDYLVMLLKMPEEQKQLIGRLSEDIGPVDIVINLIVWHYLENKLRRERKTPNNERVPEADIMAAGKALWQDVQQKTTWQQAERRLRRERGLSSDAPLDRKEVNEVYQELVRQREQRKLMSPRSVSSII